MKRRLFWLLVAFSMLVGATWSEETQALAPGREYEPMVIRGSAFSEWLNTQDINHINIYVYLGNDQWDPIPFQIDKRRKINLKWNKQERTGSLGVLNVCEYGYFEELDPPAGETDYFASDTLQNYDEIVFMLRDADDGTLRAPTNRWKSGTQLSRFEIVLQDPRATPGTYRYLYAYDWNGVPPDLDPADYVTYKQDTNRPPEDPCVPVPEACGEAQSKDPQALGLATLRTHFDANWVTDTFEVKEPGTDTLNPDLLYRLAYNMRGEDEDSWSSAGEPIHLGVYDGKIRVRRGTQGAQSGVHTTKYEFVYDTQMVTLVNLRVHPINWLTARVNHEPGIINDSLELFKHAYVWTETEKASSNNYFDQILGDCTSCPLTLSEAEFDDWTEVASEVRGTYSFFKRLTDRPLTSDLRQYIYDDWQSRGNIGEHGLRWEDIGNTQDGIDNDGGCPPASNPEDPQYHFARLERVMLAQSPRGDASDPTFVANPDFEQNDQLPVQATAQKQDKDATIPPPCDPCVPSLTGSNTGTGAISLNVSTTCPLCVHGYRVYRALGNGNMVFLKDIGSNTTYVDSWPRDGQSYRYAVAAYNTDNVESGYSSEVSIVVADTTAPTNPGGTNGTPGPGQAIIDWLDNHETDIHGYNVYMATSSGGPYNKMNASVIKAWNNPVWAQAGLQNGLPYYFVVTAVDIAGNESGYSPEVSVVPGP